MPCRGVPGKTLGRHASVLIPGPRNCETMRGDHRTDTRMPRHGPTHETRPRPLSLRTSASLPAYERSRDLPRLLPIWPGELDNLTPETHHRLLQRLRRALRDERRRGIAGSWTYDLARHARLYRALRAEIALMSPPLSTWVQGARDTSPPDQKHIAGIVSAQPAGRLRSPLNPGASPSPSSLRVASEPRHNSAPPWDSHGVAATWPGTPRVTSCNASAGDASAT